MELIFRYSWFLPDEHRVILSCDDQVRILSDHPVFTRNLKLRKMLTFFGRSNDMDCCCQGNENTKNENYSEGPVDRDPPAMSLLPPWRTF